MVAEDASGNVQPGVSVVQGIATPNTQPPTFTFLNFTAPTVDQSTGLFAINMTVNTSVVGQIFYSIYRYGHVNNSRYALAHGNAATLCHQREMHALAVAKATGSWAFMH